jgi:hypothetical protein
VVPGAAVRSADPRSSHHARPMPGVRGFTHFGVSLARRWKDKSRKCRWGRWVSCSPMRRRLFTLLSAGSLVLCVATFVLWVRSYRTGDVLRVPHSPLRPYYAADMQLTYYYVYYIASSLGRIQLVQDDTPPPVGTIHWFEPADHWRKHPERLRGRSAADWQVWHAYERSFLGFAFQWQGARTACFAVVMPHWFAILMFAALPAAEWRRRRRSGSRRRSGRCPSCGYDLRATPGRCPECGKVPGSLLNLT